MAYSALTPASKLSPTRSMAIVRAAKKVSLAKTSSILCLLMLVFTAATGQPQTKSRSAKANTAPRNVIFILADDHRYDFMGFTGKVPGLETPNMDRLAHEGAHCRQAFVSTALCSPSRASILTGQYAHTHTIVDNQAPMPPGLTFFPQHLQRNGYATAFIGKWHMGNQDDKPQKGFDHWVSFRGQGEYYNPTLNVDGKEIAYKDSTYLTDLLTDHAVKWLQQQKSKPFFLYLSHKAVHAEFMPAARHRGRYKTLPIHYPPSMFLTATDTSKTFGLTRQQIQHHGDKLAVNADGIPAWVRAQRHSWHGVDYMYDDNIVFNDFYRRYLETLLAVDESIGKVLAYLEQAGLAQSTMVVYMGDNGFSFGEHGLIDKRHMYEESMRVPLLVWAPGFVAAETKVDALVQNIDIAPTLLQVAGIETPAVMEGKSFLPLLQGKRIPWRDKVFYEYYWEDAFPQTPTIFGVRTTRYKYIFNHGVWGTNELYDLERDPHEVNNLVRNKAYDSTGLKLRDELWSWLEATHGDRIPLKRIRDRKNDHRYRGSY